jgi:hypothetical protein
MRYVNFGLVIVMLIASHGCSGFSDLSISARNRSAAYKAWKTAKWTYWDQGVGCTMREHIGRGFQQGYYDVANGGDGQLPLFPPGYYWGPEYQNPRGNEYVAAWFRGYTDGAQAAEQAGIGGYHSLPTSWAPPYASDPDSPDGGYSPYRAPSGINAPNAPGGGTPPVEGIPPGRFDTSPSLPAPSVPAPKAPPVPKSVNVPLTPGLSPALGDLQPADAAELAPPAPALNAPDGELKLTEPAAEPAAKSPEAKTPAGKQTFLPPGSPKPPLVGKTPDTAVKK